MPPANQQSEPVEATQGATDASKKSPLYIKIEDKWYDLRSWKNVHPGGPAPLERYAGEDATDAFAALHSKEAYERLAKLRTVTPPKSVVEQAAASVPAEDARLERNFRALRAQLEKDGWFRRNLLLDALVVLHIPVLAAFGTYLGWQNYKFAAACVIGVAMEQAGWAAHDYAHARNGFATNLLARIIGGFFDGFSAIWWSHKHNTHHVHPNQRGVDTDIDNEPILHLAFPEKNQPVSWYRQYQHYYYHLAFAFLFVSWRAQSHVYSWKEKQYVELVCMFLGYCWLATLPISVAIGSILIGGWLAAEVVTASHQSEEMFDGIDHRFVRNQFLTTRDVHEQTWLLWWLYGGMNYQTIHHLFPTVPRYYYSGLVPIVEQFAKDNNIEYKTTTTWGILKMNFETMRRYAKAVDENNEECLRQAKKIK